MPRKEYRDLAFGMSTPETFREVQEDVIAPTLEDIKQNTAELAPELKRIRRANELIVGDDVDVPTD